MKQLTIYLGSRCNLECEYCHRKVEKDEPKIADELIEKIKKKPSMTIKFIGGEPTLYMKDIKKVVKNAPQHDYAICTNGVNLEKYIGYFKRHNFLICISYDGNENSVREFDPFTKLIDYPRISVSTTIYKGNMSIKNILRNFAEKEKVIGRSLSFYPHVVHVTSKKNAKFNLTKKDADEYVKEYKEYVNLYLEGLKRGISNRRFEGMYKALKIRLDNPFSFGETYCVNKDIQKCDARGNKISCLYIREDILTDNWQEEQKKLIREHNPNCESCDVYDMCGGGCIKSVEEDIQCYINRQLFSWFKEKAK